MDNNRLKEWQKRIILAVVTAGSLILLALVFSGCSSPSSTQVEPTALTVQEVSFEIVDTSLSEVKNPVVTP